MTRGTMVGWLLALAVLLIMLIAVLANPADSAPEPLVPIPAPEHKTVTDPPPLTEDSGGDLIYRHEGPEPHPDWTPPPPDPPPFPCTASHPNPDVDRWAPLVCRYFAVSEHRTAMRVMHCESRGNPTAANPRSSARGLFQHLGRYWPERSRKAGWAGASIFDPEANIAVAAWLQATGSWRHWTCY